MKQSFEIFGLATSDNLWHLARATRAGGIDTLCDRGWVAVRDMHCVKEAADRVFDLDGAAPCMDCLGVDGASAA